MKRRKAFKKTVSALAGLTLMACMAGCKEETITSGYENPYTKEELAMMMKYHGSLVAKFENGQWYCLQGKRWVKINSANAHKFARLQLQKDQAAN